MPMRNSAYEKAIKQCRKAIKEHTTKIDAFTMSTVLAIAFNISKEKVIEDLIIIANKN